VLSAEYGFPHAELRVRVDSSAVPRNLARYAELQQLPESPDLSVVRAPEPGELDVLLPPTITSDTAEAGSGRPEVGQTLEGIFLGRCAQGREYDGEERAVALRLGAGVSLRPGGDPTGYRDGCPGGQPAASAGGGDAAAAADGAGSGVDAGGGPPVGWIVVGVLGIGVVATIVVTLRSRWAGA
jgi:hypothetical protein